MSDYRILQTMRDGVDCGDDRCCGTCEHWAEALRFSRGHGKSDAVAGVCELKGGQYARGDLDLEHVVVKEYHLCNRWVPYE